MVLFSLHVENKVEIMLFSVPDPKPNPVTLTNSQTENSEQYNKLSIPDRK